MGGTPLDDVQLRVITLIIVFGAIATAIVGAKLLLRADKGDVKKGMNSGGVTLIGLGLIAVALAMGAIIPFLGQIIEWSVNLGS